MLIFNGIISTMKQEVIRMPETTPSYREHALGRVASSAARLLPFQRRRHEREQQFGTQAERVAAQNNLRKACAEQFAAAAETNALIHVPRSEGGRTHDRLVFESPQQVGERQLMIVDRIVWENPSPLMNENYNISFYQPKEEDGTRRGVRISLNETIADMGDVRCSEVAITDDKTFELLAANPSDTLVLSGSYDIGAIKLLSANLANGMAGALHKSVPMNPDFLRDAMVVEQRLPELPAA